MNTEGLIKYLDTVLFEYQQELLADESRRVICLKPRRAGFSWLWAYKVLLHGLRYPHEIAFVGTKLDNAKIYLGYIRNVWIPLLNHFGAGIEIDKDNATTLSIKGGPTFLACSTNVDSLRGGTYSIYWDEAAYLPVREQKRIVEALFPMSESEYTPYTRLWIVSTPAGAQGAFYDIWTNKEEFPEFSRHKLTIWDAIKQGFRFDEEKLKRMNPQRRAREYEGSFLALEDAFYTMQQLEALSCSSSDIDLSNEPVVMGIDLGKKNDLTSVSLRYPSHYGATYLVSNMDYVDQVPLLSSLIKRYKPTKVAIDATRTETVSEMLRNEYGPSLIIPVHASQGWKVKTIESLDRLISSSSITYDYDDAYEYDVSNDVWVPTGHKPLLMDTLLLRQVQTRNGSLTYQLARDDSGHGDSYAASVLAHHAWTLSNNSPNISVRAVSRAHKGSRRRL